MIAALLLLQAAAAPPQDWSGLPEFPMPRVAGGEVSAFVEGEVEAGRCRLPDGAARGISQPVALLVGHDGRVVRVVPRAIGCPTVEQFTVGYLLALTRGGPGSAAPPAPGWYRLTVGYSW